MEQSLSARKTGILLVACIHILAPCLFLFYPWFLVMSVNVRAMSQNGPNVQPPQAFVCDGRYEVRIPFDFKPSSLLHAIWVSGFRHVLLPYLHSSPLDVPTSARAAAESKTNGVIEFKIRSRADPGGSRRAMSCRMVRQKLSSRGTRGGKPKESLCKEYFLKKKYIA